MKKQKLKVKIEENNNNNNTIISIENINNDITDILLLIVESKSITKSTTALTEKSKSIIILPNITNNIKSKSTTNRTTLSIIELANINNDTTTKSSKDSNFKSKHKELVKANKELQIKIEPDYRHIK